MRKRQIHNKPFAQKPDLAGRDGDVPGCQLALHRPFIATLDKQRPMGYRPTQ